MGVQNHRLVLLRHGQTDWSRTDRHTGRTEQELTATGREQARSAGAVLAALALDQPVVLSSPRRRARDTAALAGLHVDDVEPLLAEWDYGDYEGLTTAQIRRSVPDWLVWTHGCPGGEGVTQISHRADEVVARVLGRLESADVVLVGHGHFSRAVIARWLQLPLAEGARFGMAAASVAVCGFEHDARALLALGLSGR